MFKQPNPCSNHEICVLFERFLLKNPQDGPRFACMTCGKMLRPGLSIFVDAFVDVNVVSEKGRL